MADDGRLRRTMLFVPGDDTRKIAKATGLPADSVILDLEDGVGITNKEAARGVITDVLTSSDYNFGRTERLVRLNADSTGLQLDDLHATIGAKPDGFVLPKVEFADPIRQIDALLTEYEHKSGIPTGTLKLLALVETALGIVNLREIAISAPRLVGLIFGADDMAASLGAMRSAGDPEVEHARRELVLNCAAFGLQCIDTPWVAIHDLDGLREDTTRAMRLGYTGRTLIHPSHLEPVNAIFVPPDDVIDRAQRMIAAHDSHQSEGKGVFVFEGRMVDMPAVRQSERIVARARAAGRID